MTPTGPTRPGSTLGQMTAVRFGAFTLDTRSGELDDGSKRVRLQEQPLALLRLLIERPGQLVTREELRECLWPGGTFVDFEHSLNAAIKRLRQALGDEADNPRFVETLPRRGYRFIASIVPADRTVSEPASSVAPSVRLAVLPFSNLSHEIGQEYFSDGLTEEMIAQLGQLCRGRIGVIARWSSMAFKGTTERARAIGDALGAEYLLEGSVRREGDRARITARLVDARGETQLWAETYDRHVTDTLSVQVDVAARIARSLTMELAPSATTLARPSSTSVAAYQEYLKGRYFWNKLDDDRQTWSASALSQALSYFRSTTALDPQFAPPFASAARVHIARAQQYFAPPRTELETARNLASRALDLDQNLADAHLAWADVRRMLEWDWDGAEAAYRQALALNPSHENVHRRYSLMLAIQSRKVEAIREAELACDLDPFCMVVSVSAALVEYLIGDFDRAIERCRHILDLAPEYLAPRRLIGAAYLQVGRTADAIEALEAVQAQGINAPVVTAWLAHAVAVCGNRARALHWLERLERLGRERYVSPYHRALAYVGLGATDEALAALEQAAVHRDPALAYIVVEPRFAPVRSDARFVRLLGEIGMAREDSLAAS